MTAELPNIAKTAERLLVQIELAVRGFPRYHKFAVGGDLRRDAMHAYRCVDRALRDSGRRITRLHELKSAIDDLRLTIQLAKRLEAFRSFGQFEACARELASLGRQCGGWLKSSHAKGQNRSAASVAGQRAQILSSRTASRPEAAP